MLNRVWVGRRTDGSHSGCKVQLLGSFLLPLSAASRNIQAFSGVSAAAQLSILSKGCPAPMLKGQRQRSIERLSALIASLERKKFKKVSRMATKTNNEKNIKHLWSGCETMETKKIDIARRPCGDPRSPSLSIHSALRNRCGCTRLGRKSASSLRLKAMGTTATQPTMRQRTKVMKGPRPADSGQTSRGVAVTS